MRRGGGAQGAQAKLRVRVPKGSPKTKAKDLSGGAAQNLETGNFSEFDSTNANQGALSVTTEHPLSPTRCAKATYEGSTANGCCRGLEAQLGCRRRRVVGRCVLPAYGEVYGQPSVRHARDDYSNYGWLTTRRECHMTAPQEVGG